ncbi:MAG: hypothetical protein DDT29_00466 [Dehalococcoidia bacterium]|nr:hypothetical protein [Bacillota bacterium]
MNDADKNRLLDAMETIRLELLGQAQRENLKIDGNLLKKLTTFFYRHRYDHDPLAQLLALLSANPGKRGRQFDSNWALIRKFFYENRVKLKRFSPDELSYILGWLSRQDWGRKDRQFPKSS